MFAIYNQRPSSTSPLLQCGYRSKVCTNPRTTKIDGSLHNLCEFHRHKANQNQQRLHKRKRDEREARGQCEAMAAGFSAKKVCPGMETITVDPIPFADKRGFFVTELASSSFTPLDLTILDLLV